MNQRKIAYVDESGDAHFTKGSSKLFILSAFIIEESEEASIRIAVEKIRSKNFQTGQIKSQLVADNHGRRESILRELSGINFKAFVLIIDKGKIASDWVKYTHSFYKFIHGLLHKDLFKLFPNLKIIVDKYGDGKYQESFANYIEEYHIPSLFDQAQIEVGSSKSNILIQCADFLSGSLTKSLTIPEVNTNFSGIKAVLDEKILSVKKWPEDYKSYVLAEVLEGYEEQDKVIAKLSINLAQIFVDENKGKQDALISLRVKLLETLLFNARFIDESEYVTTNELLAFLNSFNIFDISVEFFRSEIIGKIRDDQVIVASSRNGLKLPTRYSEIVDYLNTGSQQVYPMLARMKSARETILGHTMGKIDIVDHPSFKYLKDIYDAKIV